MKLKQVIVSLMFAHICTASAFDYDNFGTKNAFVSASASMDGSVWAVGSDNGKSIVYHLTNKGLVISYGFFDSAQNVTVLADPFGGCYVTGSLITDPIQFKMFVYKLKSDCAPDQSFSGDGVVWFDSKLYDGITRPSDMRCYPALSNTGKLYLACSENEKYSNKCKRVSYVYTLDALTGAQTNYVQLTANVIAMAVTTCEDGIFVSGCRYTTTYNDDVLFIAKLLSDGSLNQNFGSGGTVLYPAGAGQTGNGKYPRATGNAISYDGTALVVVGGAKYNTTYKPFAASFNPSNGNIIKYKLYDDALMDDVLRFTTNDARPGFYSGGGITVITSCARPGGTTKCLRLRSDLEPDSTFGTNGAMDAYARAVIVNNQGDIVFLGCNAALQPTSTLVSIGQPCGDSRRADTVVYGHNYTSPGWQTFTDGYQTSKTVTETLHTYTRNGYCVDTLTLVPEQTNGVDGIDGHAFDVYPNPATDWVNIPTGGVIRNTSGAVVVRQHRAGVVDISALPSGVYIFTSNNNTNKKIIKD